MLYGLDFFLFQQFNNLAGKWPLFDAIGVFCAEWLIFILFALPFIYFLFHRKKEMAVFLVKMSAVVALAWTANQAIGSIIFRSRPFVYHAVNLLINKSVLSKSFPSDHTALAFAVAFSAYFFHKKIGVVFLLLASLVALGRIFVGVHYPIDVLAGAAVAFLSVLAIEKIANSAKFKIKRKKLVISFKKRINFFK